MYRVIETELGFLFDFFYSRYPSHKQSLVPETIVFATAAALSMSSLFSSTLMHYNYNKYGGGGAINSSNSVVGTRFDIWLARLVIFMFLILETVQYLSLVLSDWHRVKRYCRFCLHYRREANEVKLFLRGLIFLAWELVSNRKYWSNTVGQYSLLHACIRSRLWLPGWMSSFLIRTTHRHLPNSVKDAIAEELKNSLPTIMNQQGIVYYEAEHMTLEVASGGRVVKMRIPKPTIGNILILHIATTICGWKQQQQADQQVHHGEDQETASTISAYCAYLICDAPELITDNIYEARLLLEGVKRRAPGCLGDCRSEDGMYTKLLEYSFKPPKEDDDEYMAILAQGVSTYRLLASKFPDDAERWKLLAQLWVKFLLSNVAPSNNLAAHVKRLASGGEFITHLWAFMTQGGFVKQPWVPCGDGKTQQDLEAGRRQDR
ncbi:hypothetical protein HU200_063955 [Digitaria exilis]|uniref:DUF4220 domain-containing protein n=1 Tax=Digitaria exilis TaxID=1010633 RepID=A0A835DZ85_9POAL|nr:hypothetical protein HU200_063955 [Digitaria exilis]